MLGQSNNTSNKMTNRLKYLFSLAFVVPLIILLILLGAWNTTFGLGLGGTTSTWSNLGSFLGGLFGPILSYFSILAVLLTLYHQQKDSKLILKNNAINTHSVILNMFIDYCDREELKINPYKLFNFMFSNSLAEYIHEKKASDEVFLLELSPNSLNEFINMMKLDAENLQVALKEKGNLKATTAVLQLPKLLGLTNLEVVTTTEQLKKYLELAKSSFETALEFPSFYINENKKKDFVDSAQKYIDFFIKRSVDKSEFNETLNSLNDTHNS
ncbi:hypothetical protein P4S81_15900 [Pseudoalteromonas sp. B28]